MPAAEKAKSKKSIQQEADALEKPFFYGETEFGKKFNQFAKGKTYMMVSTLIMIYTLFSDDMRYLLFPASADQIFSILTLICMTYYLLEIIAFSLFQKDYFLKYYFWLDLMSTLTMCFDLIWISQYITGGGKTAANISQISRASRAARLGTRTVKLIRLIRMIKLLRQLKTFNKGINKTQKNLTMRKETHSRMSSNKNLERLSSIRHLQKLPSKRWSLIKQTGCMNVLDGNQPPNQILSIHLLPYKQQDEIIDRQSIKSGSSKKIQSLKQIKQSRDNQKMMYACGESSNIVVAPLQKILQQVREDQDVREKTEYKNEVNVKRSKHSITNKEINEEDDGDKQLQIPNESKVGQKLQNQIRKNVILLIILILVSIPLLEGSTWFQTVSVYDKSLMNLVYFAKNYPAQYHIQAKIFIDESLGFLNPLISFKVSTPLTTDVFPDNYPQFYQNLLNERRSSDIDIFYYQDSEVGFDNRGSYVIDSIMNIVRTIFVCIILVLTTLFFSNDLEFAAIAPLEDMFDTVRRIAINPLNALRQIEAKNLILDNIELEENKENTEPKILQNTIVKIGSLLAVGFGQAGTQIICRVIQDPSIINVMIPGQKIMAIFGFCDIRNFTDATQVLEADVMVFVNEIAQICHKVTYEHLGSPNKNIGDAFLLVWKFSEADCKVTERNNEFDIELIKSPRVQQKADLAVLSIIKMIADITKSKKLQKYKNHPGLKQRIKDYNGVKMGFGLHVGWAIQGPIGSQYKIDASYLSSHVHMASRLQAATKAYGTGMLITGDVYNLMNRNRHNLRHIDRVLPSGQTQIMDLYTVDVDSKHLFQITGAIEQKKLTEKENKIAKVIQNINRKELLENITKEGVTDEFWNDQDVRRMKEPYKKEFYEIWNVGFKQYLEGNWAQAMKNMTKLKEYAPYKYDGPSESLMKHMELNNEKAPQDWKGFREFE